MTEDNQLMKDILMNYHNVHGKTGGRTVRIHQNTTFLARERVVEFCHRHTQERFLHFLPLKHRETKEYLRIPNYITTEDQLWDYVEKKKPYWLDHQDRRRREY